MFTGLHVKFKASSKTFRAEVRQSLSCLKLYFSLQLFPKVQYFLFFFPHPSIFEDGTFRLRIVLTPSNKMNNKVSI